MKKIAAIVATALLAVTLVGCGSQESPKVEAPNPEPAPEKNAETATPADLEIIESGWVAGEQGFVHYGLGLKNPNAGFGAEFPTIKVTGKDADGKIVFSDEQVLMFMLPGAEYYYGGQAGNGTAPATVEFSLSVSKNNWIPTDKQAVEFYTISNTNEVKGQYGNDNFTGELTVNEEWESVTSACVSVILRDAEGSIVSGYCGFADLPAEGQTTAFDVMAYDVPDHASYEVYAQPW